MSFIDNNLYVYASNNSVSYFAFYIYFFERFFISQRKHIVCKKVGKF